MKKFIFLTYGYETPTQEIMNAWNNWFASFADKMVDRGGPVKPLTSTNLISSGLLNFVNCIYLETFCPKLVVLIISRRFTCFGHKTQRKQREECKVVE
jgi:hypothetical protein